MSCYASTTHNQRRAYISFHMHHVMFVWPSLEPGIGCSSFHSSMHAPRFACCHAANLKFLDTPSCTSNLFFVLNHNSWNSPSLPSSCCHCSKRCRIMMVIALRSLCLNARADVVACLQQKLLCAQSIHPFISARGGRSKCQHASLSKQVTMKRSCCWGLRHELDADSLGRRWHRQTGGRIDFHPWLTWVCSSS